VLSNWHPYRDQIDLALIEAGRSAVKVLLLFLAGSVAFAGWEAAQRVSPDHEIEVATHVGKSTRGRWFRQPRPRLWCGRNPANIPSRAGTSTACELPIRRVVRGTA
jgi:hypothetical protein